MKQLKHKLLSWLLPPLNNQEQLKALLKQCTINNVIEDRSLMMIEGVLQTSKMQARDIMIPRAQMICIDSHENPLNYIKTIQKFKHSRYPVIGKNKDDIIGILLAKDMLVYFGKNDNSQQSALEPLYHEPFFVPESRRIDELLKDFQINHTHMAIIADEYGGVAGLVTIEDIIEQIVGDIEDEFYEEEIKLITKLNNGYLIQGETEVTEINKLLKLELHNPQNLDTISGLLIHHLGHIPIKKEKIEFQNLHWEITAVENNCIKLVKIKTNN